MNIRRAEHSRAVRVAFILEVRGRSCIETFEVQEIPNMDKLTCYPVGVTPNSRRFDASIAGARFDCQSHRRIFVGCITIMPIWLYGGAQCLISHRTTGFLPIS